MLPTEGLDTDKGNRNPISALNSVNAMAKAMCSAGSRILRTTWSAKLFESFGLQTPDHKRKVALQSCLSSVEVPRPLYNDATHASHASQFDTVWDCSHTSAEHKRGLESAKKKKKLQAPLSSIAFQYQLPASAGGIYFGLGKRSQSSE